MQEKDTKSLEDSLKNEAECMVNFEQSEQSEQSEHIEHGGSTDPNGVVYTSFGFEFREHEVQELRSRWLQWIESFVIYSRDLKLEGTSVNSLSDHSKVLNLYWRKFPKIEERPTYPGQYIMTARLSIGH